MKSQAACGSFSKRSTHTSYSISIFSEVPVADLIEIYVRPTSHDPIKTMGLGAL
jgi:hypothetical protein